MRGEKSCMASSAMSITSLVIVIAELSEAATTRASRFSKEVSYVRGISGGQHSL